MRRFGIAMLLGMGLLLAAPYEGASAREPAPAVTQVLDINSASPEQLDALPGIGPARAAAIVKGRPYKSKDELVRKKILPQKLYNSVKDRLVAHAQS